MIGLVPGELGRLYRRFYLESGAVPAGIPAGFQPLPQADRNAAIAAGFPAVLFDGNSANGEAGTFPSSRVSLRDFDQDAFLVRTDHYLTSRWLLNARYAYAGNSLRTDTAGLPGTRQSTDRGFHSPTVQLIGTLSPTQIVELRVGVMRGSWRGVATDVVSGALGENVPTSVEGVRAAV